VFLQQVLEITGGFFPPRNQDSHKFRTERAVGDNIDIQFSRCADDDVMEANPAEEHFKTANTEEVKMMRRENTVGFILKGQDIKPFITQTGCQAIASPL